MKTKAKYHPRLIDKVNHALHEMIETKYGDDVDTIFDVIPNNFITKIASELKLREVTVRKIVDKTWNTGDGDEEWNELDVSDDESDYDDNNVINNDNKHNECDKNQQIHWLADGVFDMNMSSDEL